jgi:hypothetical protein
MKFAPKNPEGFPEEMWIYHWFSENRNWTPQQVDELTLEQAHWLPLLKDAQSGAQDQLSDD